MQNFQTIHCVVLQAANQAEAFNLVHPHDRHGKPIADRHCTREVEEALNDYRAACDTARAAVRGQLRLLAETLQVDLHCPLNPLPAANAFAGAPSTEHTYCPWAWSLGISEF